MLPKLENYENFDFLELMNNKINFYFLSRRSFIIVQKPILSVFAGNNIRLQDGKKFLCLFRQFSKYSFFFKLSIFLDFSVFRIFNDDKDFSYDMLLKDGVKTFNLTTF